MTVGRPVSGKIERIELYHVDLPLPTPLFPVWIPGYPQYRQRQTLLCVTTKDGLTGYASCPAFGRERQGIGDFIGPFLLGLDPYDVDSVTERLAQASHLGFRNHWMDTAFWDLAAKRQGVPLHALVLERLKGDPKAPAPDTIPVYASFMELRPPRVRAESIERAQRVGFKGAKICVHASEEAEDHAQLRQARSTAGEGFELMVHAHQAWSVSLVEKGPRWDVDRARRFLEVAAETGMQWVQEPLHDESWEQLAELSRGSPVPLAGGDLTFSYIPIHALVRDRCYRILTPDTAFCGVGNVVRTMRACRDHGVDFSPSSNGDGLGLAANLHAVVAWSRLTSDRSPDRLEYPWEPPAVIPEHRDALLQNPLQVRSDGTVEVPTAAGLGVELDARQLRRFGECFYSTTPVRFAVSTARREGLGKTADFTRQRPRRRTGSGIL